MTPAKFKRLRNVLQPSRDKLKTFRDNLAHALRQFVGQHYGSGGSSNCRPINMIEMAVTTYLESLASKNPQVLCITHLLNLRPNAAEMELAINEQLKRMKFAQEHRLWVLSALFGLGIMRTGLEITNNLQIDGEEIAPTQIFCEAIMLDDWVHDASASKWNPHEVTFCGHRYRMSLEAAKKNPNFDTKGRELLTARVRSSAEDRTDHIGQDSNWLDEEFDEQVELWDIWVPSENEVVTFPADGGGNEPLRTVKWKGPRHGPYQFLSFNPVLNNIMPLPPVANWLDLDDLENNLYTKLGTQARRQMTLLVATPQGMADANRVIKAEDGDVLCVDDPNAVQEKRISGIDPQTLGFAQNVKMMASYVMGNLDALAGLATTAGTLGQEKIIKDSSNDRMRAMQTAVATATRAVVEDVASWMFNDPTIELDLKRQIPGTDIELDVTWPYQEDENGFEIDVRQGGFDKYKIDIQPYSMQDLSPGERLQMIRDLWRNDITPLTQFGLQPDINAYLNLIAKYADLPELLDLVPEAKFSQEAQNEARKSPVSSREYVRRSVSAGMTPQAEMQQREMQMLGGGGVNNRPSGNGVV